MRGSIRGLAMATFAAAAIAGMAKPAPRVMSRREAELLDPIVPPPRRRGLWSSLRRPTEADLARIDAANAKRIRKSARLLHAVERGGMLAFVPKEAT